MLRVRLASAGLRLSAVAAVSMVVIGCGFGSAPATASPAPSLAPQTRAPGPTRPPSPRATQSGQPTDAPSGEPRTFAIQVDRPNRGITTEPGKVAFGTGWEEGRNIKLTNERARFGTDAEVAWRVTLPATEGGEEVSIVLVSDGNETILDEFTAEAGWNVYYGRLTPPLDPGTYRLRYFYDGEQVGGGKFTIRAR